MIKHGRVGSWLVSPGLDKHQLVSSRLSLNKNLSLLSFKAVDLEEVKISSLKSGEAKSESRRSCLVGALIFFK